MQLYNLPNAPVLLNTWMLLRCDVQKILSHSSTKMERATYLTAILKISRLFGFLPYQGENSGVMNTLLKIPQLVYPASLLPMLVQTGIILLTTEFNLVEDAYKFLNVCEWIHRDLLSVSRNAVFIFSYLPFLWTLSCLL